jgi:hypothetical protein
VSTDAQKQAKVRKLLEAAPNGPKLDTLTAVLLSVMVEKGPEVLDVQTVSMVLAHAGLKPDMNPQELVSGIVAFVQKHPPDTKLLNELKRALE